MIHPLSGPLPKIELVDVLGTRRGWDLDVAATLAGWRARVAATGQRGMIAKRRARLEVVAAGPSVVVTA